MKEKILITGGLGYIGSHIAYFLHESYQVLVIDLITKENEKIKSFISDHIGAENVQHCDLCDIKSLYKIFKQHLNIKYVIHASDLKNLVTSTKEPLKYYYNNMISMLNLLKTMQVFNVQRIIFSSSAAVYGLPMKLPVQEGYKQCKLVSPYARAKYFCENILEDVSRQCNIKAISLRYFNIVGQAIKAQVNKREDLLNVIADTMFDKRPYMKIFGNNLPTNDGYSARDYVHIVDLVNAYKKSLILIKSQNNYKYIVLNISSGKAISTKTIIEKFEKFCNKKIKLKILPPRQDEVTIIYGSNVKAQKILNWVPMFNIDQIIDSIISNYCN